MQRYSSSAPEPILAVPYSAASRSPDPKNRGSGPLFLAIDLENRGEAAVDVKGRGVGDFGVDHAAVDLGADKIVLLIHDCRFAANHAAVKVDGGHPLDIAAVRDLIAFCVETVSHATVGDDLLGGAKVCHVAQGGGNGLTTCVEAYLTVHVNGKACLGLMDALGQYLVLVQQIQQQANHVIDAVGVFAGSGFDGGLVLSLGHHLAAQQSGLHLTHIAVEVEDALGLIHQGLQFVLETEGFFQIHTVRHSFKGDF